MKKIAVLISGAFLMINTAFAGGILTNSNQSAQFVRMLSRNASTDLDAVYFNPAGLTQLKNGFYFGLHNQTIFQNRTITSDFPLLNNPEFNGKVTAPAFPTAFAVYKLDNWAFSAGFGPNAGGGSAKFESGIPSFEKSISALPMSLTSNGIPTTNYSVNMQLEASSVFFGTQLNASYKINEHVSVFGGVRIINAVNTYNGYIKDIMINPNVPAYGLTGEMISAPLLFTTLSGLSNKTANDIQPYVTAVPNATLPQLVASNQMSQQTADALANGLGISSNSNVTIQQIQSGYQAKSAELSKQSEATADKAVDTKQTGFGFTPMIGANFHFDKLNISLRYEHMTTLVLTNSTKKDLIMADGNGLFPDKGKSGSDIPAIIAAGADYKITNDLKISGSYTLYMDKWVGWGNNVYGQHRSIDKNYLELAFGVQYNLTKKFAISAGYLNSNTGVSKQYQSDFSFSNDSYTAGLGFQWNINKRLVFDAGMMLTTYKDDTKSFDSSQHFDTTNTTLIETFGPYTETYAKDTFTFAFGIGYKIF